MCIRDSVEGAECDGELIINSDHAMTMERVPERPIVLGASAVGVEFASVWKGYGAREVTIIEALETVVPREDVDTSKALLKDLKKSGMKVHVGTCLLYTSDAAD